MQLEERPIVVPIDSVVLLASVQFYAVVVGRDVGDKQLISILKLEAMLGGDVRSRHLPSKLTLYRVVSAWHSITSTNRRTTPCTVTLNGLI